MRKQFYEEYLNFHSKYTARFGHTTVEGISVAYLEDLIQKFRARIPNQKFIPEI